MNTNTIAMCSDVMPVDVLSGRTRGDAVARFQGPSVLPVWRPRRTEAGVAPIAAVDAEHNSTRVSVPGCRGRT